MLYNIDNIKVFVEEEILSPSGDLFGSKLVERLKTGEWEAEEFEMLNTMPSDCTVLELGGCIGFISCATNRLLENKENHVVVEANSNLIETIKNNKNLNDSKFKVKNCIVSSKEGSVEFYVDKRSILGSSTAMQKNRIHETLDIETKTIREIEQENGLVFDALICDIEGGEYELFLSEMMQEKIKELRFISVEFHWNIANSKAMAQHIVQLIREEGFDVTTFTAKTGQLQLFAVKDR